ncbi:hypothetical protein [Pyrobaculum neutrophilum]|uniref:Uncharacterized protein n=1 Tax=Pyrobaculum neutrophilum (strain DSM 2338 / JCM 9278 / NBRC 100436 / V24Sta) TaxID=444157 RepID=B1Y8R4_PYRNV|nr:hypothetical protein [Pyrobaculum neutrophilum]ACB40143.1 conserved hypothetical protein [Pyrobaculum neutrophilum V24Sta]
MEDLVAASAFIVALSALTVYTALVLKPFMPAAVVEAPIAPARDAPVRHIYVYNSSSGLYAVEYEGAGVEEFRRSLGVPGDLVAVFEVYPGGYRCSLYGSRAVRLGADPYTGLWCPPPFRPHVDPDCVPVAIAARGRWLVAQYRCP